MAAMEEALLHGQGECEDNENDLSVCLDTDLAKWGDTPVPRWIQATAVRHIIQEEAKEHYYEPIDLNRTAGPAVQWGLSTLVGLTYFLGCLPVVGTYIARCPSKQGSREFAQYPEVLLWIIFFAPLTCMIVVAQWKMCCYTLVPMLQQIRRNRVNEEDRKTYPFAAWYLVFNVLTVFNLLDQMTNALFTSKTWATRHCYGYQFIKQRWQDTIADSFAMKLLFIDKMGLDFAEFTACAYVLQLIIQPAIAAVYSLPVWWNERRSEGEECGRGLPVSYNVVRHRRDHIAEYKTLSDNQFDENDLTSHASAAVVLAEVNRMEAVVALDLDYRKALCKQLTVNLVEKLRNLRAQGNDRQAILEAKRKTCDNGLEIAIAATGRGMARFLLKGLVQNAVQVNLQVSMAAISKTTLDEGIDLFNAFSIGLTIISMFGDIPDILSVFSFANKVLAEVGTQCDGEGPEGEQLKEALSEKIGSLSCRLTRLKIYGVLYMLLALMALMKLVFAVGICRYGTWNASSIADNWGCTAKPLVSNFTSCPVAEYVCNN
mmetsp:Transcript_64002/g.187250  ORF Transcript_64002/g.187250 Transcript_64002/m.187250 type:complete len:543 (+) Transcript_64002:60-1688(+)